MSAEEPRIVAATANGRVEPVAVAVEGELVSMPRDLLQAILDYLCTCPAGQVYPLIRRLDTELAPVAAPGPDE